MTNGAIQFFILPHCRAVSTVLREKRNISCHLKNISWNQFTVWMISEKLVFTKFFWEKFCEIKVLIKMLFSRIFFGKNSVKSKYVCTYCIKLLSSRNFFLVRVKFHTLCFTSHSISDIIYLLCLVQHGKTRISLPRKFFSVKSIHSK